MRKPYRTNVMLYAIYGICMNVIHATHLSARTFQIKKKQHKLPEEFRRKQNEYTAEREREK